jgi:orotate phosphoribosyltransferase
VESSEVIQVARPRSGHFDLGTGYHGDVWLDLDALLLRPSLLRPYVGWLAERLKGHSVDAVCGPLEGGAFLAGQHACALLRGRDDTEPGLAGRPVPAVRRRHPVHGPVIRRLNEPGPMTKTISVS